MAFDVLQIYDTPKSDLKLNDVIEFIGIHTFNPELAAHEDDCVELSFNLMDDFMNSRHCFRSHAFIA